MAHYVASKGAVWTLTRALARELGTYGLTVNAVAPGITETEGVMAGPHRDAFDFCEARQCLPGRGRAEDIVPAITFLASEESRWITGQLLVCDGGMTHS
jgi:pyridoxal 4-dehydrogenase